MDLRFISYHRSRNLEKSLARIYNQAFPADEQIPLFLLKLRARQGKAAYFGILDGKKLVGLVYNIYYKDLIYVLFLAIDEKYQGCGYGSRTLEAIQKRYPDRRIFLCIECLDPNADNYEQRLRRKAFYERNGFSELPFQMNEGLMTYAPMAVAGRNPRISKTECEMLMVNFFGVWGMSLYAQQILDKILKRV